MTDAPRGTSGSISTQIRTHDSGSGWEVSAAALRVAALTVLYHPDLERIGERTLLTGLTGGGRAELSRKAPEFAAPGSEVCRPLGETSLSRTPITLSGEDGEILLDRGASRTRLTVDGQPIETSASVSADALEDGVVLLLSGRIVLLLHLLDPLADLTTPRFGLVGESPALAQVRRDIVQVADLDVPVLLRGESGTGKELVARAIHRAGARHSHPFIAVNMAAVPPNLAAAELFGAERGAYTGAQRRRTGHFQQAHGGTLFLDEIGEAPPEVQTLLLRALETAEVRPVGGERAERVDVRVVSATDTDLEAALDAERFRAPLLHRLSGYVLALPPLRERREDFGRLLIHFLRRELEALDAENLLAPGRRPWLPAPLVARLAGWHWPGNVRQLANVVRQIVIANRGADPATRFEQVEALLARKPRTAEKSAEPPAATAREHESGSRRRPSELHEEEVIEALRTHRFRPSAAADALGIPRSSIYDLIDRIPGLRKGSDLGREEIAAVRARVGPSVEAMAAELEVSERALRRRLGELDLLE
jgi:two-component system nitrogen regulation response regulator GlnG